VRSPGNRRTHRLLSAARTLAAAAALALSHSATAADRPPLAPTRDVVIDYAFTLAGDADKPVPMRFYIAAGGGLLRVDQPNQSGFVVIDRDRNRTLVVLTVPRFYFELPYDPARRLGLMLNDSMAFSRHGAETIAGVPCTVWSVQDGRRSGTACISTDGFLLRAETPAEGGRPGMWMQAISVLPAEQPASVFQPPTGYRRVDPLPLPK